jgi:hypothetical protein
VAEGIRDRSIRTFTPDDGPRIFYIAYTAKLEQILELAQIKWPGITPSQIDIEPQHIHTDCLGYDRYDPGDYTNYLAITAAEDYQLP